MTHLVLVHLAFTLSFLTLNLKIWFKRHKNTITTWKDGLWCIFCELTEYPKLLCVVLNVLVVFMCIYGSSQWAFKMCKWATAATEIYCKGKSVSDACSELYNGQHSSCGMLEYSVLFMVASCDITSWFFFFRCLWSMLCSYLILTAPEFIFRSSQSPCLVNIKVRRQRLQLFKWTILTKWLH